MSGSRLFAGAGLMFVSALMLQQCTSTPPSATPAAPPASEQTALTAVLSVKELMEHIIDPTADWIFDAAVIDVSAKGTVETKPISDDDWLKVERGALLLAESSNLLKMPRTIVPPGFEEDPPPEPGKPAPELAPAEIQAKIEADRGLWNKHADELRTVALESLKIVKARDFNGLFQVGSDIDRACENCHLEYWYPGDKKTVLEDQKKTVTFDKPKP